MYTTARYYIRNIVVLVLLSLSSIGCQPKTESDWKVMKSSSNGFSILYPNTWTVFELPYGNHGDTETVGMLVSPNKVFPVVLIVRKEAQNLGLQDIASWGENRIVSRYTQYQLDNLQPLAINSAQVLTRTYLTDMNTSLTVKSKDVYISRNKDAIIITLRARASEFEDATKIFDQMVKSFSPLK